MYKQPSSTFFKFFDFHLFYYHGMASGLVSTWPGVMCSILEFGAFCMAFSSTPFLHLVYIALRCSFKSFSPRSTINLRRSNSCSPYITGLDLATSPIAWRLFHLLFSAQLSIMHGYAYCICCIASTPIRPLFSYNNINHLRTRIIDFILAWIFHSFILSTQVLSLILQIHPSRLNPFSISLPVFFLFFFSSHDRWLSKKATSQDVSRS